jgi:hypothetical protein
MDDESAEEMKTEVLREESFGQMPRPTSADSQTDASNFSHTAL